VGLAPGAQAVVQGHRQALHTLLRNLLDNAIKYSNPGGRVDIAIERNAAGEALLSVEDAGPGIADEERDRVFDRFYRGESAGATGSGLGLSIVKRVADAHGATIGLGAPDHGTGLVVTVRFPPDAP